MYVKLQGNLPDNSGASVQVKEYAISGLVTDADNNALSEVEVFVVGMEDHALTNGSGSFSLKTKAAENSVVVVRVFKSGYKPRMENVKLPSSGLIVALSVSTSSPPTPSPDGPPHVIPPGDNQPRNPPPVASSEKTGRIYTCYGGDVFSCFLQLRIRIGDREIVPVGNFYPVSDIPLGDARYEITGTIACPTLGACTASGSGRLTLQSEGNYNVVWQNTSVAQCDARLAALQ